MRIELYPHQREVLPLLRTGSVLAGGTGSGKSRAILAYWFSRVCAGEIDSDGVEVPRHPVDLLVITTPRKRDTHEWEGELLPFHVSTDPSTSLGGIRVVVDSWNNLHRYTDTRGWFVVFDEQRAVGHGKWAKAFVKVARQNDWVMLSATPGDTWLDYWALFTANGFYRNRTDFCRQHVVWKPWSRYPVVDHYVGVQRLEELRRRVVVPMPDQRHTVRHHEFVTVGYDKALYDRVMSQRWSVRHEKPLQNASELVSEARWACHCAATRWAAFQAVREAHKAVVVFYNFDYELEVLRERLDEEGAVYAEWNGHRHEPLPTGESWVYLVQYAAGDAAWNCTTSDCVVFWSMTYSWRRRAQCMGRIDRLNTPFTDLWYYTFRTVSSIDRGVQRALERKEDFNERLWAASTASL